MTKLKEGFDVEDLLNVIEQVVNDRKYPREAVGEHLSYKQSL